MTRIVSKLLFTALFASACTDELEPDSIEGDDTAITGDVKPYVVDMQWSYLTSAFNSDWWRSPTANCTSRTLYGMGVALPFTPGSTGSVLFRGMIPQGDSAGPTGGKSAGQESYSGLAENWNMTAYATCGTRLSGHQVYSATSSSGTSETRSVIATCPDTKRLIGAGATINGADGLVKIDEIRPGYIGANLRSVAAFASKETQGSPGSWSVTAYAICAFMPSDKQPFLVQGSAPALSAVYNELIAECPAGTKLLSSAGGFRVSNPKVTRLNEIIPSVNLKYTIVRGSSRGNTSGLTGTINAYAVCVNDQL